MIRSHRLVLFRFAMVLMLSGLLVGLPVAALPWPTPQAFAAETIDDGLELQNLNEVPFNDRLIFHRIHSRGFIKVHDRSTLRLRNTSGAPMAIATVTITGSDAPSFQIINADDKGPFTIEPGGQRDIEVRFVAGTRGAVRGQRFALLQLQPSTPGIAPRSVELAGYNQVTDGGKNEPVLQEILDTLGYATQVIRPGEGHTLRGAFVNGVLVDDAYVAVGDEVLTPAWLRADATKPMLVHQLLAMHGFQQSAEIVLPGATLRHIPDWWQTFYPIGANNRPIRAELNTSTTTPFTIRVGGWSTDAGKRFKNHAVRAWPARDRDGYLIPNTYILAGDYLDNPGLTNWDYQDNIYLLSNVRPSENGDPSRPAPAPGDSALVLDFNQAGGGLADKDGQGTGFPEVQRNKGDVQYPQNAPSTSYNKAALDLDPAAGTLTLNAQAGSNAEKDNTLVNGLCRPFDGRTGRYIVATTLKGPFNNLVTPTQMAGLMFGMNQGSYVRLVVGAPSASGAKPAIQLAYEQNNVITQTGQLVPLANPAASKLDLQLLVDTEAGTISAAYAVDGGPLTPLAEPVTLKRPWTGRLFDPQSKGCLLASSKGGAPFNAVYDRFAITAAPPPEGLPTVNAGPDQQVALSANVTLSGTARDTDGNALTGQWEQISGPRVELGGSGNGRSFTAPNSYSILTFAFGAVDAKGRSASDTIKVTVGQQPVGNLTVGSNSPVEIGKPLRLNASAIGAPPIRYEWNFGDDSAPVIGGPVTGHRYAQAGAYTVTVTASNSVNSVSKQLAVRVQQPIPDFALRYDTGIDTGATTTPDGKVWRSDKAAGIYTPAAPAEKRCSGDAIANTTNDAIYCSYRGQTSGGPFVYEIPLNSQLGLAPETIVRADLRLHFAELFWTSAGKRVFDINIEGGQRTRGGLDIFAAAGGAKTAYIESFEDVVVSDGKLTIRLQETTDNVALAAIEVLRAAAEPDNLAPSVDAGENQTTTVGREVTLNGSIGDPDGDALTANWRQVSGPPASLRPGTSNASNLFTPQTPGSYVFELSAVDPGGLSATDTVTVAAAPSSAVNTPPTVEAGNDVRAARGNLVALNALGNDPDGDLLSYSWAQVGGPNVPLSGSGATTVFTPSVVGSYVFRVTATDPGNLSATDSVTVTVVEPNAPNRLPLADAGSDRAVRLGTSVVLDGSRSSDPDSDALSYNWTQVAGPGVTLTGGNTPRPSFTAPQTATTLTFRLIVTDAFGVASAVDDVTITVGPSSAAGQGMFIPLMLRR